MNKIGFTLTELMVVVVIIGLLALLGVPVYIKTIETSRADKAVEMIKSIANAQRAWFLDHNRNYIMAYGFDSNAICNPLPMQVCEEDSGPIVPGTPSCHVLIGCGYLPPYDWDNDPWRYVVCNDAYPFECIGTGVIARACRKPGPCGGGQWGYRVDPNGVITPEGGAPQPK
ncbi:MAG: type II secretion system protein [Elusimicrobia bacterium]|nr:type II secretion system protein [Elusimicrobiota bacterium]